MDPAVLSTGGSCTFGNVNDWAPRMAMPPLATAHHSATITPTETVHEIYRPGTRDATAVAWTCTGWKTNLHIIAAMF